MWLVCFPERDHSVSPWRTIKTLGVKGAMDGEVYARPDLSCLARWSVNLLASSSVGQSVGQSISQRSDTKQAP